jgi:hypothetical protein
MGSGSCGGGGYRGAVGLGLRMIYEQDERDKGVFGTVIVPPNV